MKPVVILGGGINGAALARELTLNRIPVHVVDIADIASGATAYSSRLIHGGLRYLEHGDFRLVRESLEERKRLLKLAPHLVKPLCLHIPSSRRLGGFWAATRRFLGMKAKSRQRGAWLIRAGLSLYDRYANDNSLPRHKSMHSNAADALPLDAEEFPYQSAYWDGQVHYAERLVVAMLEDARRTAEANRIDFAVTPYGDATLQRSTLFVRHVRGHATHDVGIELAPSMVVNATGAWLDHTLARLEVDQETPLVGGTAGSHILTANAELKQRLNGRGVYAEAKDGRPFFVLPFGNLTLIGTTDIKFQGDPRDARATPGEIAYLIDSTNHLFAGLQFSRQDVALHYCGIRPLPQSKSKDPGAITRDHQIVENPDAGVPMISLVGGKLTTARAFAEEVADLIIERLNLRRTATSEDRPLPGAIHLHEAMMDAETERARLAQQADLSPESVAAIWDLYGDETSDVLEECQRRWPETAAKLLPDSVLPESLVRYAIHCEWVTTIDDLISRRLMLLFSGQLTSAALQRLAQILSEEGIFEESKIPAQVTACRNALQDRYGLKLN